MKVLRKSLACAVSILALLGARPAGAQDLVVGSKPFTESRLLGEILRQWIELRTELLVDHRAGLAGSLCFDGLRTGALDLYPEYTGTGTDGDPGRAARFE